MSQRTFETVHLSMYKEDIERIDRLVADAKSNGCTSASRSSLIRLGIKAIFDGHVLVDAEALREVGRRSGWEVSEAHADEDDER